MPQAAYFGPDQKLFGIYHPPAQPGNGHVVLICTPLLEEAARAHWVLREISKRLAQIGIGSLRFHFTGHGNSLGAVESCNLATWSQDLEQAAIYLRSLSPIDAELSVFAPRFTFGLVGACDLDFRLCCGWDPITRASDWHSELQAANLLAAQQLDTGPLQPGEFAGYSLGGLLEDLPNSQQLLPKAQTTVLILGNDQSCLDAKPDYVKRTATPYGWNIPGVALLYLLDVVNVGVEVFQEGLS